MTDLPDEKQESTQPATRDVWDKIDILGKLIGSILIPFALAFTGFLVSGYLQDRSAKQKTQEVAIEVLRSEAVGSPLLREWAENVFKEMLAEANSPLSQGALEDLKKRPLPSTGTKSAVDLISEAEGFAAVPASDGAGTWTIGFGHVLTAEEREHYDKSGPISLQEGRKLLEQDMAAAESAVDELVTVELTAGQRAALVSFYWNTGKLAHTTVLKLVNARRFSEVPDEIMRWTTISGRRLPGLVARRAKEIEVWNSTSP